jgi:hypothetical protein
MRFPHLSGIHQRGSRQPVCCEPFRPLAQKVRANENRRRQPVRHQKGQSVLVKIAVAIVKGEDDSALVSVYGH